MEPIDFDSLDPGIRETVRWLRSLHFETSDSGDGETKLLAGWDGHRVALGTDGQVSGEGRS